ncbi:DUF4878 domain-containing protein [Caenorhabditis elegans]|uniref:DUF4878 domain-containing protein n=1 Tax=Caenorhabditis elegans TaxID=6239 RepID=Q9NA36_CAEEL|nr:DUF4878 domain-containing protein [Caenorhabditis elegans]CAB70229.1 DUF4878 domain-containing protein [Caenorhabditis elegans]|eukprot:NP_502849.1 Uncharacterized protein CELE_Y73F8A.14 [Caenorhabditis elegans]
MLRLFKIQKTPLSQFSKASNEIVKDFIEKMEKAAGSGDKVKFSDCFTEDFQFFACSFTANKAQLVEKHLTNPNPEPVIPKYSNFDENDSKIKFTVSRRVGPEVNIVDFDLLRENDGPWRLQSGKVTNCP